jgi:hypothetical protein
MADVVPLADRTCRARRSSVCHLCGCTVLVGQQIGRVHDGRGRSKWVHTACLVAALPRRTETVDLPPFDPDAA